MKSSTTIKLKVLFLLVTFSCNSVVGFACSMGVDMGFNSGHHKHEEAKEEHEHGGHTPAWNTHNHTHNHSNILINASSFNPQSDENCCNNFIVGFQNLDKQLISRADSSGKRKFDYAFFIIHPETIFVQPVYKEPVKTPLKFLPFHSPPDIRVFIQSFQI